MSGVDPRYRRLNRNYWQYVCRRCRTTKWKNTVDPHGHSKLTCINGHVDQVRVNQVLG